MAQPPGFVDPHFPDHVCRLKKTLYGLLQAPFAWFQQFRSYLLSLGFRQTQSDYSLFYLLQGKSLIYLFLYVDDIIITGNDQAMLCRFIAHTHFEFAIKYFGQLNYFLGLENSYTSDDLFVGQAKYAHDILERADLLDSKPISTPLVAGKSLVSTDSPFRDPTPNRSLVGALQYLTITQLDLSFDVNSVS